MVIVETAHAQYRRNASLVPWLVHIGLLVILLISLLAAIVLLTPPAHAQTVQAQQSQQAVVVTNRWQFNRGFQDGYRDTVRACILGQHNQLRSAAARKAHLNDYQKGYLAGVDSALKYARVCRPHPGHK